MNENGGSFTYSPPAVRISKSEDQLQCPDNAELSSANTDLEDDVTASLNTLLDTREDSPPPHAASPATSSAPNTAGNDGLSTNVQLFKSCCSTSSSVMSMTTTVVTVCSAAAPYNISSSAPTVAGGPSLLQQQQHSLQSPSDSVQSSHGSDSPLLHSPSPPQSPVSPSSSVPYSSSGVYDKMMTKRDHNNHSALSGNVCSNSSSLTTSPDTDIPDELEWDETTPSYIPHLSNKQQAAGATIINGHASSSALHKSPRHVSIHSTSQQPHRNLVSVDTSSSSSSSHIIQEKVKRKKDENRIVIKVAGPDKSSSSSTIGKSSSAGNSLKRKDSTSSADNKSIGNNRRLPGSMRGSVISSAGVTTVLTTSEDGVISPSVESVLTSTHGGGVIPGTADPDLTPTNTPQQTPPVSPTRSLQYRKKSSSPNQPVRRHSSSNPSPATTTTINTGSSSPPPNQVSPQTPGSGTLSPDTLAYQQLWESEDEFTASCVSEDDGTSRSQGAVSSKSIGSRGSGGGGTIGADTDVGHGPSVGVSSPPLSEDESDIESLHSFHYSPKAVDIPSAVRLAKRLYHLDGFKKTDVSRHLSKNNEFSRAVAEEYLQHFDFTSGTLDQALRCFLERFCLTGETQERERVLVHFSRRYLECNPGTFNSQDAVHTLTCALMLLNTDLHGHSKVGRPMTCAEFINNLAELNDGQDFNADVLRNLHASIKNKPLKWSSDSDDANNDDRKASESSQPLILGGNPFLAPVAGDGIIYKKGYIMRKCCTDPNGKRTSFGKRSWKMWWCVVQDLVLYLYKDEQCGRRSSQHVPPPQIGTQAIRLHHALATRAHDYNKKQHVFRLYTADQAEYLLQTSDSKELQGWIDTINFVAASLSAPPMAGAVGSQKKFQRPLLPCSITKLNLRDQTSDHQQRLVQLETELEQHCAKPPDKNAKSNALSNYKEKETYLNEEIKRYRAYVFLLRSRLSATSDPDGGGGVPAAEQLPVFRPGGGAGGGAAGGADPSESGSGGGAGNGRVVPPPIPDRSGVRHTVDRYSYHEAIKHHALV